MPMSVVQPITRDDVRTRLEGPAPPAVVDAMPPTAYEQNHLPGAVNITLDRVDELAPQLLPDKEREIVVYCGNRP
jgi:rhodanese-related sulfurtransferase